MNAKHILSGKRLAIAFACLVLCAGLLSAASALSATPTAAQILPPIPTEMTTPVTPEEIRLTEGDSGRRVQLSEGQALVISLEGNPSTGYTWAVVEVDEKILRQVGEIEFKPESNLLGAPGKQILSFEVVGEGQSALKLVYHRPWEKDVEPAKEFSVQVVGRPASTGAMVEPAPKKGSTKPKKKLMHLELPKQVPVTEAKPEAPGEVGSPDGWWINLMTEGFEWDFPGTKWTVSGDPTWDETYYRALYGSRSGYCADGGPNRVPPPGPYPNNMVAFMMYGPFGLSDATYAELRFYHWTETEGEFYDGLFVGASIDGEGFYGVSYSGDFASVCDDWGGWCCARFDLTHVYQLGNLCGQPQVWIAFVFWSDESYTYEGTYLDDIVLRKEKAVPGLPEAFDWRDLGGLTSVKDQGMCGSCWAFSTVSPLEANIKIKDGITTNLSEQYLLSCNTDGWDCCGGWYAHDYHQWKTPPSEMDAGAVLESEFPYASAGIECEDGQPEPPCCGPYNHPYKITSWACIGADDGATPPDCCTDSVLPPAAIKQAIMNYGPVSASVNAGPGFASYEGGVFEIHEPPISPWCCELNHAIELVGWDDTQGTSGVYILKNSWGTDWGESGYMRIGYTISNVGCCANYVVYTSLYPYKIYLPITLKNYVPGPSPE